MKSVKLEGRKCNVTGEIGLVPKSLMGWYNGSESYVAGVEVGHDVLTHFQKGQSGTIEQELVALGVEMWMSENYRSSGRSSDDLGADLHNTFRDGWYHRIEDAPRYKKGYWEDEISVIESALFYTKDQMRYDPYDEESYYIENNKNNIIGWIIAGIKAAKKRYNKHDPWDVMFMRGKINEAGEKLLEVYEYQSYTLHFNIQTGFAQIIEDYEDYY